MVLIEALGFMALFMLLLCVNTAIADILGKRKALARTGILNQSR